MKPTNNFEEITEEEFERRERKKAEYRNELMQQIREQQEKKHNLKKQDMLNEVKHEQRIYKQLHEMQQEYISDEIKKVIRRESRKNAFTGKIRFSFKFIELKQQNFTCEKLFLSYDADEQDEQRINCCRCRN